MSCHKVSAGEQRLSQPDVLGRVADVVGQETGSVHVVSFVVIRTRAAVDALDLHEPCLPVRIVDGIVKTCIAAPTPEPQSSNPPP